MAGQKNQKAPVQGWFMSPFGGVDRAMFDPKPDFSEKDTPAVRKKKLEAQVARSLGMREWFQHLYDSSNFHFTGAYLTGKGDKTLVTRVSRLAEENWTRNWSQIERQGWGIWPLYQAWSNLEILSTKRLLELNWETTKVKRGIAAANHIKDIVSQLPGTHAGMVVYLDNEGGVVTPLLPYYKALYNTLQTDLSNRPALRAGIYIREGYANEVMSLFPDIYVWFIDTLSGDLPKVRDGPYPTPIEEVNAIGNAQSQRFLNERYPITRQSMLFVPVGRQCTLGSWDHSKDTGKGYTKSDIAGWGPIPGTISPWDFDVSFVRDPRFPQANPRFVCQGKIVYCTFDKKDVRTREVGTRTIPMQGIEPEAPLVRVDQELYSIDKGGNIVMTTKRVKSTWKPLEKHSPWDPLTTVVPNGDLRRMRAFTIIKSSPKETLLFYISSNHQIQVYRRLQPNLWDVNKPVKWEAFGAWNAGSLHPFTNMCTAFFKKKVWLFFMQGVANEYTEASLTVAEWQGATQELGRGLKGTGIAAVATTNHLFVFVIGKDRQLYYAYAYGDDDKLRWSTLKAAGKPTVKVTCLPHTKVAACIQKPTLVRAAVMSANGVPCVYDFNFADPEWGSLPCKQYPLNDKEGKSPQGFAAAKGWTVNPYGDIAMVQNGQSTELYCTGCAPDTRGILLRNIDNVNEPWFRLDDEASATAP